MGTILYAVTGMLQTQFTHFYSASSNWVGMDIYTENHSELQSFINTFSNQCNVGIINNIDWVVKTSSVQILH